MMILWHGRFKRDGVHTGCILFILVWLLCLGSASATLAADKKMALLPIAILADPGKAYLRQGLESMLASRLSGEGLDVVGPEALQAVIDEKDRKGITSEKRAEELGRMLKAEYVVFGSITSLGPEYSLDLAVLDLTKGEPKLTRLTETVPEDKLIPKLSDVVYDVRAIVAGVDIRRQKAAGWSGEEESAKGLFFKPSSESYAFKPTGRTSVKTLVMAMDMGDLDGDKEPELVVLSRERLMIYVKQGESLALKDSLEASRAGDFLKVSVGDLDQNGKAEIYLVHLNGTRAETTVWEWTGKFTRLYSQIGHIQAVKDPGSSRGKLFHQDSRPGEFFSGPISIVQFDRTWKMVAQNPLPDLKGAQFYTLSLFDLDKDGKPEILGLGEPGIYDSAHIHVWDQQGKPIWRSDELVGGTNNAIEMGPVGLDRPTRISFNSRLLVTDIDGDGKREVLAVTGIPFAEKLDIKLYYESSLSAYRIEGTGLVPAFKSRKLKYCVTDMQAHGSTIYLAAQRGQMAKWEQGSSQIMWFE